MKDNRKIIQVLTILTIIFTVMGGSLAYWNWNTTEAQKTVVKFGGGGIDPTPWCTADGGGNITQSGVQIVPTTCTDSEYVSANPGATPRVIKRKITVTADTTRAGSNINLSLWLKVNTLGSGLSQSNNFRYVLTTSSTSCEEGEIISEGTFSGITDGGEVNIISNRIFTSPTPQEYWLYIWLDWPETNSNTMNQPFNFTLKGSCTNYAESSEISQPEKPVLDDGMIPVKIDENGDVFTVSKADTSWYDYGNKEWANAVLVSDTNRQTYLNNLSNNIQVDEDDILAYYVWIPRYKYRIPYKKCSEIPEADRNMEDYPECYAPYTMSDTDKDKLAAYYTYSAYCVGMDETERIAALSAINYALENGKTTFYNYQDSIVSFVETYNSGGTFLPANCDPENNVEITLTPSSFNGNNRLIGFTNEVSIDIEFESVDDTISRGDAVNTYYTHPAFIWDGEAVSGLWVGKFETTPDKSDACYTNPTSTNCNDTTQKPTILPNEAPLVYQQIGNQFATSQNFTKVGNVYGLTNGTTDGHMMKNSEWGAVAYLSHSMYGINKEITINNYYNSSDKYYKTGCGALVGVTNTSSTCTNAYRTEGLTTYPQSTTGNITGIFDMSGGASENVMGNYNNTTNTDFPTLPESKYYDVYLESQFPDRIYLGIAFELCTLETCGGHALMETIGWYDDYTHFIGSDRLWVTRGGHANGGSHAGMWALSEAMGSEKFGWRSVLITD